MENTPKNLNPTNSNTRLKELQQLQMKTNKTNGGNRMVASENRTKKGLHIGVKH